MRRVAVGSLQLHVGNADPIQLGIVALRVSHRLVSQRRDNLVGALPVARDQQHIARIVGEIDVHQVLGVGGRVDIALVERVPLCHILAADEQLLPPRHNRTVGIVHHTRVTHARHPHIAARIGIGGEDVRRVFTGH